MSTVSTFNKFQVALVTGGGGGLGKAIAKNFVANGKKVIIAGRTTSKLEETAKELGPACIAIYNVDLANLSTVPSFAEKVLKEHPEVDCLVNNAGVQKELDFTKDIDFKEVTEEVNINVLALVQLCGLFSSHLLTKPSAVIINVTSGLSIVPIKQIPVYCATKAFVKSFTLSLRAQFNKSTVTIVDVCPPLVESELHRDRKNPSVFTTKNSAALSQDEFIRQVEKGWKSGDLEVGAGTAIDRQKAWRDTFEKMWLTINQL